MRENIKDGGYMKKTKIAVWLLISMMLFTGCNKNKEEENQEPIHVENQEPVNVEIQEKNLWTELKNINFIFSSGAGGWQTEMSIAEDGTFQGVYYDGDLGVIGENYPNGTYYYCSFFGKFAKPVKQEEYSYSTAIESISFANTPGTEEIKDGMRYVYSEAIGLNDAKEILIYLPGMPIEDLPQGYLSWVMTPLEMDPEFNSGYTQLPFYGLYNVNSEQGFSGYDVIISLKERLDYSEEWAATLEKSISQDPLTQAELNEKTQQLYEIWDDILNEIWSILKRNLSPEEMRELTEEQLEWIASKEQSMKEAGADVEGGSMYGMVVGQKGAELTKERVYELLTKLEDIEE